MTFSYRLHWRGFIAAVALSMLLAAVALGGFVSAWRIVTVVPLAASVAVGVAWVSGLKKARQLGSIVLDADAVRRVRGDGRVISALRWGELRRVVVDRRGHMVLLEGAKAKTLLCHGPALLGGVGVERFDALLDEIGKRTSLPLTPASRRLRRRSRPLSVARQGA